MKKLLLKLSSFLSDYWFTYLLFLFKFRTLPNFKKPRSLSEKIQYIKLYNRNPLRALIADRLKVRDYVASKSKDCKLIALLWQGVDFNEKVWNELPREFVIKANHGSKMVKVVNKDQVEFSELQLMVKKWLSVDYSDLGREWIYRGLEKYILIEEKLEIDGEVPPDFKFFVLNQKTELVQIDLDRFHGHKRNLYDRSFNLLNVSLHFPSANVELEKPAALDKALKIAEELAIDLDFVRVDLYLVGEDVYFGELTNTPGNGFERFQPLSFDYELGAKLPRIIER